MKWAGGRGHTSTDVAQKRAKNHRHVRSRRFSNDEFFSVIIWEFISSRTHPCKTCQRVEDLKPTCLRVAIWFDLKVSFRVMYRVPKVNWHLRQIMRCVLLPQYASRPSLSARPTRMSLLLRREVEWHWYWRVFCFMLTCCWVDLVGELFCSGGRPMNSPAP